MTTYLLHLDALDEDVVLLVLVVVVEESSVQHDWVVLLRNLVRLRQVAVRPMLPVELDLRKDAATECQRSLDRLVEAVLVEHR